MKTPFVLNAARALLFAAAAAAAPLHASPLDLTVMTRNLYVGADLGPVIAAAAAGSPTFPLLAAQAYRNVEATTPDARMQRMAQEILLHRPHVVGLQEMSLFQTRELGSGAPLTTTFDFQQALSAHLGGQYTLVTTLAGVPVPAVGVHPTLMPTPTEIVLTDRAGILVRNDVQVLGSGSQYYTNIFTVPGLGLPILRGISYVDVAVGGIEVRVASTHLESVHPGINFAQSGELADFLGTVPYRQVALGDFNSLVEPVDNVFIPTGSDANMMARGFRDAWLDVNLGLDGFTWRNDELLDNPSESLFSQRLDYVFHRGAFQTQEVQLIGAQFDLDFATAPYWGSDHAGVLATLQIVPAPGVLALMGLALVVMGFARRSR